jgi:maleate cis-trans isomerase
MTFEEFKKEVEKDYYAIDEIAYMASEVDEINDLTIKALSYLSSIEEAENNFKDFLKTKGIEIND